jgi:hypothetical protein
MTEKKVTYKAETLALPSLKMVVGEIPDPDPGGERRPLRPFGEGKTESEAKGTLTKLIGHLKNQEK